MASLMSAKLSEVTSAIFSGNGLDFNVSGSRTLFKGYEAIYGEFEDDDTKLLPEIQEKGIYGVAKIDAEQKFTQAPAAYSEAKVVKLMNFVILSPPIFSKAEPTFASFRNCWATNRSTPLRSIPT